MNKEFCTYKQALSLKELGFNEPCFTTYDDEGRLRNPFDYERSEYEKTNISYIEDSTQFLTNESLNSKSNFIIAPLKQQAFRWFREKYNLWVEVKVEDSVKLGTQLYYWLIFGAYKSYEGNDWIRALYESNNKYSTYEEAEEACLNKLIEICKNK